MKPSIRYLTLIFLTQFSLYAATSMSFEQLQTLHAADANESDYFGYSVAIEGDTAAIAAGRIGSGSAYVFQFNPTTRRYEQRAQLSTSIPSTNDSFGRGIAISGDTVVVGAHGYDDGGKQEGAAYLYVKPPSGWNDMNETALLTVNAFTINLDMIGFSVAIDADTVLLGAPGDDWYETDGGAAYLFQMPPGGWTDMNQTAKFTPPDPVQYGNFGSSVGVSGDVIAVGAKNNQSDTYYNGAVYIYEKPPGGWIGGNTPNAKLIPSDTDVGGNLGFSVAIEENTVVAGSPDDYVSSVQSGSAYLFVKSGPSWTNMTETAKLTASDGGDDDEFGHSVSLSSDMIVVGAQRDDDNGSSSGSAYLFEKSSTGWSDMNQSAKLTALDAGAGDIFGSSVSINGSKVIIGAYLNDDNGSNSGSAYLFQESSLGFLPSVIMFLLN